MDQPSSFWLMPDPQRTATRVLWSDAQDDWFQILKVDGENVSALTREQMTAGLFPADGHPITLTVKPHSGPVRRMPCFATESGDSKAQ